MDEVNDLPVIEYSGSPADTWWQALALCAEVDTEIFYPEDGTTGLDGKRVCRACDVRAECLSYAINNHERFGVWGGMLRKERLAFAAKHPGGWTLTDVDEELERNRVKRLKDKSKIVA